MQCICGQGVFEFCCCYIHACSTFSGPSTERNRCFANAPKIIFNGHFFGTSAANSKKCKSKRLMTWCILATVKRHTPWHVNPYSSKIYGGLNCCHSTLIRVCYSTSPSWQVQRLSRSDWSSPQLIFGGWNAKRGPSVQVCLYSEYCSHWPPCCML